MDNMGKNLTSLADIEAGLERLMPRGLGEETRGELEAMVDDFASKAEGVRGRSLVWQSLAAALCLAAVGGGIFAVQQGDVNSPRLAQLELSGQGAGLEILEQLTWIDGGADLGVRTVSQEGDLSQGWGYSGVEEERLLHSGSGYEVILQRNFEAELYATSSL